MAVPVHFRWWSLVSVAERAILGSFDLDSKSEIASDHAEERMAQFAGRLLNKYIAPGVSEFNSAEIPDMTSYHAESAHWVDNHFLNNSLRGALKTSAAAYIANYLRRAEGAFSEHALARSATNEFLRSNRQSPSRYAEALLHWEFFLGQSWQAYVLLQKLVQLLGDDDKYQIFEPGDGSLEQRLNLLYNAMKHVEKRIATGQLPEDTVSPVWLTNQGVACTEGGVTFEETGEILRDLAKWADIVVDPLTMAEKLKDADPQDRGVPQSEPGT